MKKILFIILGMIAAGIVLLFAAKDVVLKISMVQAVSRMTGLKTTVHSLKYDVPSTILITELEILNPSGFQEKVFVRIPEMYASFDLFGLLKGKGIHFSEIRLNIQEIHIEKNSQGVSNMDFLKTFGAHGEPQQASPKPSTPFLLEQFEFSLRDVSYQDRSGMYGSSGLPDKLSVDMNIQKRMYQDIHDPQLLVNLILAEIVREQTFGRLLNLNPAEILGENLYEVFNSGQAFIGEQTSALFHHAGAVVQNPVTGTQGIITDTTAAVQKAASGIFEKLKSLTNVRKTNAPVAIQEEKR